MRRARLALAGALLTLAGCGAPPEWSEAERRQIAALALSRLGAPPADPTNAVADHPAAVAWGAQLFFDARLSARGTLSCASCHRPERFFTDGRALAQGLAAGARNTPTVIGAAWSRWLFWDGRADSLWSQAAGPLLHAAEMGSTARGVRAQVERHYADQYTNLFGPIARASDERVLADVGKVLAAYVRTLRPAPSRFDAYAEALAAGGTSPALNAAERRGLRLFLGRGRCIQCHQGPLLTDHGFHNTGLTHAAARTDRGRIDGVKLALASPFNCRSPFSDSRGGCPHLDYVRADGEELVGAFKTPSLRHVASTAPYMHDGRFATLREVLEHYNRPPTLHRGSGHSELLPLGLTVAELADLEAFLIALGPDPLADGRAGD